MFTWFKKEKIIKPPDNIYTVLSGELERMHDHMRNGCAVNSEAQKEAYMDIFNLRKVLVESLEKNPNDHGVLKDLQDSVADLYLTGTESKD